MAKKKDKDSSKQIAQTTNGTDEADVRSPKDWIRTYGICLQSITTVAAVLAVIVAWRGIGDANERLRELVNARSRQVLDMVELFSPDLADRRYLVHEFGGNAFVSIEELKMDTETGTGASRQVLRITCEQWGEGAYGGVNFFGNEAITGRFVPINLGGVQRISFDFRYPARKKGLFFLRMKNARNLETHDIPIKSEGERGSFQKFEFNPGEHPQIKDVLVNNAGEFYLVNLAVATDFGRYTWEGDAQIDIRSLQIDYN